MHTMDVPKLSDGTNGFLLGAVGAGIIGVSTYALLRCKCRVAKSAEQPERENNFQLQVQAYSRKLAEAQSREDGLKLQLTEFRKRIYSEQKRSRELARQMKIQENELLKRINDLEREKVVLERELHITRIIMRDKEELLNALVMERFK